MPISRHTSLRRLVIAAVLAAALPGPASAAETSGKRVAMSNNYAGNSWRQAMLASWEKAGKTAVADKQLSRRLPS